MSRDSFSCLSATFESRCGGWCEGLPHYGWVHSASGSEHQRICFGLFHADGECVAQTSGDTLLRPCLSESRDHHHCLYWRRVYDVVAGKLGEDKKWRQLMYDLKELLLFIFDPPRCDMMKDQPHQSWLDHFYLLGKNQSCGATLLTRISPFPSWRPLGGHYAVSCRCCDPFQQWPSSLPRENRNNKGCF